MELLGWALVALAVTLASAVVLCTIGLSGLYLFQKTSGCDGVKIIFTLMTVTGVAILIALLMPFVYWISPVRRWHFR